MNISAIAANLDRSFSCEPQLYLSDSLIHTHIHALMAYMVPTAHQEQFGVQYLAQGLFDIQLGGSRDSNHRLSVY